MDASLRWIGYIVLGQFAIEKNANATRVECNGLLASAGEDTKVNLDQMHSQFYLSEMLLQAVTHSHGGDKSLVRLVFRPEEGAELEPEFRVIIVRDYSTYWTGIKL